ncbi:MAG: Verru_Chthon cassette protein B [Chthoniobacteraceae bacterium]
MNFPFSLQFQMKETRRAFTLIETAVALGIIAFSLLAMIGVMPVGLTMMRQAMDMMRESQIVQQITAKALLTPYSELAANFPSQTTSYYDEQGDILTSSSAAATGKAYFRVTAALNNTAPVYPGSTNSVDATGNFDLDAVKDGLRTITIQIATGAGASAVTNSYVVHVPNSGN